MRRGGSSRLNIVSISKYSTTAASKANTNAVPAVSSTSSAPALTGLVSAYNDSSDSEPEPNGKQLQLEESVKKHSTLSF